MTPCTFSSKPTYKFLCDELLCLITETDTNTYHGPKLRRNLEQWARNGRQVTW
jgi:hypothetical protein